MINIKSFNPTVRLTFITGLSLLLFTWALLMTTPLPVSAAGDAIQGTIWVADEFGNSLTVINANTNEVITTLTGIEGPHNIQVSPDGASVWAVSGHDSTAVLIDALTYELIGTVPTGEHPAHIILSPDGKTAYVTNSGDNTVTAIDVTSLTAVATIPVGEYPHGLRSSPDGRWIYVANTNGTTLSVIDTATNTRVADIEVGQRPVQVAFSPDGALVYVSLNAENAVAKVDVASQTLIDTIEVGVGPVQVFVTPDDSILLVANQGTEDNPSTTVSIIDTASFSVVNTIETGVGAHGVVVEPSGQYAYITNLYENSVSVLDLANQEVIASVQTGSGPNGISFSQLPASPALSIEIALVANTESSEPTADEHTEHHPETEVTPTPQPDTNADSGMGMGEIGGTDMMSMMDAMMGIEMSDEMRVQMEQMRGMMDTMMSGEMMPGMDMMSMMGQMSEILDAMMGIEMSDEMRVQMEQMRGMMDMMMSGEMMPGMVTTPDATSGMEMETEYSVDNLAPLALAYYEGGKVYFIHPEASDEGVAEILTNMMGTDVLVVPSLAEVPEELLSKVYVFTNGVEAMGPLGYQPDVFDSVPGDEAYTPLRSINLVTWQENAEARELTSIREILEAEENGEVIIEHPGVVVNMPILVWPNGQR